MEHHAHREFTGAEIFNHAVDDKGAVRHHCLDNHTIVAAYQAPDLYRFVARVKELESVLSDREPSCAPKPLGRIRRQAGEQALRKNAQTLRCLFGNCGADFLFCAISTQTKSPSKAGERLFYN